MSGYFGALMRSSGMPFGGAAPVVAGVEPRGLEIDVEAPTAMPSHLVQPASTPRETVAPIPIRSAEERPAPPAPIAADSAHDAQPAGATPERAHSRDWADAAAEAQEAPATRAVETSTPTLGEAMIRAAMRWVAADAPQVRSAALDAHGESQPARIEETRVATTEVRRERGIDRQVHAPSATPPTAIATDRSRREPIAAQAIPIRPARSALAAPPVALAPLASEEVVEVSIGAIHVRVDAPVAQTVAQPAARPPAAPPRAAATARSALSRRALRRI